MSKSKQADSYFLAMGFRPVLTPDEILRLGAFDAHYYGPAIPDEFPAAWRAIKQAPEPRPELNAFGVHSGQSREIWVAKGWMHDDDPLGWFQWYCRYYLGRRHDDDARQIQRWKNYVRHRGMLYHHAKGQRDKGLVQRQSLIHWAYDPFPDFRTLPGESVYDKTRRMLGHAN